MGVQRGLCSFKDAARPFFSPSVAAVCKSFNKECKGANCSGRLFGFLTLNCFYCLVKAARFQHPWQLLRPVGNFTTCSRGFSAKRVKCYSLKWCFRALFNSLRWMQFITVKLIWGFQLALSFLPFFLLLVRQAVALLSSFIQIQLSEFKNKPIGMRHLIFKGSIWPPIFPLFYSTVTEPIHQYIIVSFSVFFSLLFTIPLSECKPSI